MIKRLKRTEDENSEKVVKFCGRETKRQMQRLILGDLVNK